jgi:hypothetical protein
MPGPDRCSGHVTINDMRIDCELIEDHGGKCHAAGYEDARLTDNPASWVVEWEYTD